jgi:hypothetical protein
MIISIWGFEVIPKRREPSIAGVFSSVSAKPKIPDRAMMRSMPPLSIKESLSAARKPLKVSSL